MGTASLSGGQSYLGQTRAAGPAGAQQAPVPSVRPPYRSPMPKLYGREAVLDELQAAMRKPDGRPRILHGLGGVGKSAVALELAHRVQGDMQLDRPWVFWIRGDVDIRQAMLTVAERLLGPSADITQARLNLGEAQELVWNALRNSDRTWLLVFDNVDDPRVLGGDDDTASSGASWLRPCEAGLTVVTSRQEGQGGEEWPEDARWIELRSLDMADGSAVLRRHAPAAGDEETARALSERLGGLPLALYLAGRYLRDKFAEYKTFADYQRALDEQPLIDLIDQRVDRQAEARKLVGKTWELSLSHLETVKGLSSAGRLLRLLSCYGAPHPIPYQLLVGRERDARLFVDSVVDNRQAVDQLTPAEIDELAERFAPGPSAGTLLSAAGFPTGLVPSSANNPLEFWQLVAQALAGGAQVDGVRAALSEAAERLPDNPVLGTDALRARYPAAPPMGAAGPVGSTAPSAAAARTMVAEIRATVIGLANVGLLDQVVLSPWSRSAAETGGDGGSPAEPPTGTVECFALHPLVAEVSRLKLERSTDREPVWTLAQECLQAFTPEDPVSLTRRLDWVALPAVHRALLTNLPTELSDSLSGAISSAVICSMHLLQIGALAEAHQLAELAFTRGGSLPADNRGSWFDARAAAAQVNLAQGGLTAIEGELETLLSDVQAIFPASHSRTLAIQTMLAETLFQRGRLEDAVELYEEVIDLAEAESLPDAVLAARRGRAQILVMLGEMGEAEEELTWVLAQERELYGDDEHPNVLFTRALLADILANRGELDAAQRELEQVLAVQERLFGTDNPQTMAARVTLMGVLATRGNFGAAEGQLQRMLKISHDSLEPDHPLALLGLAALQNFRGLVHGVDSGEEAERRTRQIGDSLARTLYPGHPMVLVTRMNAAIYHYEVDPAEAIAECQAVFEAQRTLHGDAHPATLNTRLYWVLMRSAADDPEAETELDQLLPAQVRALGELHPQVVITHNAWAHLAIERGDEATAEEHLRQALAGARVNAGPDHEETQEIQVSLLRVLARAGRLTECEVVTRDLIESLIRRAGPDDADVLGASVVLGLLLQALGRLTEAEETFRDVLGRAERHFPDDSGVPIVRALLGEVLHQQGVRLPEALELLRLGIDGMELDEDRDDDDWYAARVDLGQTLFDTGEPDQIREAEIVLRAVLEEVTANPDADQENADEAESSLLAVREALRELPSAPRPAELPPGQRDEPSSDDQPTADTPASDPTMAESASSDPPTADRSPAASATDGPTPDGPTLDEPTPSEAPEEPNLAPSAPPADDPADKAPRDRAATSAPAAEEATYSSAAHPVFVDPEITGSPDEGLLRAWRMYLRGEVATAAAAFAALHTVLRARGETDPQTLDARYGAAVALERLGRWPDAEREYLGYLQAAIAAGDVAPARLDRARAGLDQVRRRSWQARADTGPTQAETGGESSAGSAAVTEQARRESGPEAGAAGADSMVVAAGAGGPVEGNVSDVMPADGSSGSASRRVDLQPREWVGRARAQAALGRLLDAEELYTKALGIADSGRHADLAVAAAVRGELGLLRLRRGDLRRGELDLRAALIATPDDPAGMSTESARWRVALARICRLHGRLPEAAEFLRPGGRAPAGSAAWREAQLLRWSRNRPSDRDQTLRALADTVAREPDDASARVEARRELARLLARTGRWGEASDALSAGLPPDRIVDASDILALRSDLAEVRRDGGQARATESELRAVLAAQSAAAVTPGAWAGVTGPTGMPVSVASTGEAALLTWLRLGRALADQGHTLTAVAELRTAAAAGARLAGDDGYLSLRAIAEATELLLVADDQATAARLARPAYAAGRDRLGDQHELVLRLRTTLAVASATAGPPAAAEAELRAVLVAAGGQAAGSRLAVTAQLALSAVLTHVGQLVAAEELARAALAEAQTAVGSGHPAAARARAGLARVLASYGAGRGGEALAVLAEALAVFERVYGRTHPETVAARRDRDRVAATTR